MRGRKKEIKTRLVSYVKECINSIEFLKVNSTYKKKYLKIFPPKCFHFAKNIYHKSTRVHKSTGRACEFLRSYIVAVAFLAGQAR
jgi:hypothetical protein